MAANNDTQIVPGGKLAPRKLAQRRASALAGALSYRGKSYVSRWALADHLAPITGRTTSACHKLLARHGDNAAAVVAHCRKAKAEAAERVISYDGKSFRTRQAAAEYLAPIVKRTDNGVVQMLIKLDDDIGQVIAHYRALDEAAPSGELAMQLQRACDRTGADLDALTVLSKGRDPYRFDTPRGHRDGRWFKDQIARFVPRGQVHLRGLHYRLSASADVIKPNGKLYVNSYDDWRWLVAQASNAGRWLGYVPFWKIVDQRNTAPILPDEEESRSALESLTWVVAGAEVVLPDLRLVAPKVGIYLADVRQPYRIVLFGEKASLRPVLEPIRDMVDGELLLPTGESTTTMVYDLAKRCAADGRPAVVLYFSDFDPSGHQMAISVARKLQALETLEFDDTGLDIRLLPVALTYEQVRRLDLPSTPLREGEQRADKWRAKWDHEQTEIDALAALDPAELDRIAREAVAPYYDPTLAERRQEVVAEAYREARAVFEAHPEYQASRASIEAARDRLAGATADLKAAQDEAQEALQDIEFPPLPEPPQPELSEEPPTPLYDSRDDYVTATRRLMDHKALDDGEDADDC